ncbi:hypothetical protein HMPREF1544_05845 [Mucor circinelloides 1006PhL]|uniref:Uncharacterized protein n=1 Tax=Mucor circinelloides f. circinelloides (strain 1006PhL) TaxID=1220926 RepID=S2K547_MUCC1|nr:hypothetical protein HMPREF1544_05845 [Mucor circinelloides 1006PhL]
MNQDDLSNQLHSFSISSGEDKITDALDKTHIASLPAVPSIFSLPQVSQSASPQQHVYSGDVQNKTNYVNKDTTSDWDPSSAASHWSSNSNSNVQPPQDSTEDGWGEGPPSYTSIPQGTYFGFNSILEAPKSIIANSPQMNQNTTAFSRFRHTPVTFTSAAAEAASKNSE